MTETLAIIGAGRVGRALGRRLRELGWKIGAVVTRNESSARRAVRFIGAGTPLPAMARRILASTCILIATPDSTIASVAEELARELLAEWSVGLFARGARDQDARRR